MERQLFYTLLSNANLLEVETLTSIVMNPIDVYLFCGLQLILFSQSSFPIESGDWWFNGHAELEGKQNLKLENVPPLHFCLILIP